METEFREVKRLKLPGVEVSYLFLLVVVSIAVIESTDTAHKIFLVIGTLLYITVFHFISRQFVLSIVINTEGIQYKYPPVIRKLRVIPWIQVLKLRIVKYEPIRTYLGWGFRNSKKYGRAYTTDGNYGLYINYSGRNTVLLGIKDLSKLREYLVNAKDIKDVDFTNEVVRLG